MRTVAERFASFCGKKDEATGCIPWTGTTRAGYGTLQIDGGKQAAHRLAWVLAFGPIPDGLCVCHACDNPLCVNIDHLLLGTVAANNRDALRKGRHGYRTGKGEKNPRAKLTQEQVEEIRNRHDRGLATQSALASEFGMSTAQVSNIVHRRQWMAAE